MKLDSLKAIAAALEEASVRYLVVGGVAVNAHGYQRLTHDLDLVVSLDPDNLRAALDALAALDPHPETAVHLFAEEPFDFDTEYDVALRGDVDAGLPLRFVRLETLVRMKEETGRARDVDDAQHLRWIEEELRSGDEG